MTQDFKHGASRSAAGFAIVLSRRVTSRQHGPANMHGIGVRLFKVQNKGLGFCAIFDGLNAGQKSAFFDDQFMVHRR